MLPIVLDEKEVSLLMEETERGSNATLTVDLESQDITTLMATKLTLRR